MSRVISANAAAVAESLMREGWCRLGAMDDDEYRMLMDELGHPWSETVVELREDVRTYLCQPNAVPFHTDHPDADWIAWRCEAQDEADGAQQILDGLAAVEACGHAVRDLLTRTHAHARVRQGEPPVRIPLLRSSLRGDRLFFAPWLDPVENDAQSWAAFRTFKDEIEHRSETHVQEVRLNEGEVLVINNGRMLHGRRGLGCQSGRRLRRFWITLER